MKLCGLFRQRSLKLFLIFACGLCILIFCLHQLQQYMSPVPSLLTVINFKLSEMEERLKYYEFTEYERSKVLNKLNVLLNVTNGIVPLRNNAHVAWAESRHEYQMLAKSNLGAALKAMDINFPSMYVHLPHITQHGALIPALVLGNHRSGVYLTIGIPTVPRQHQSYLVKTVESLINSMDTEERKQVLIVVLVAERGLTEQATSIVDSLKVSFNESIKDGLLEVLVPPKDYYPRDIDTMEGNLGDSAERTRWRTKQNLDYIYLMSYCRTRGLYYMQLEDDVITKLNFFANIKFFIDQSSVKDWFMLEFSSLGFIGKLFRCRSLPLLIHFIAMFHRDQPVDWLLFKLLNSRFCGIDKTSKQCQKLIGERVFAFKPKLFQHIGVESSLKGKIQKLKEVGFSADLTVLFKPHINPSCHISSSLKPFKTHTLSKAYEGKGHFWAFSPMQGDYATFEFIPPVNLTGFTFRSGSPDHPGDLFNETIAEVKTLSAVTFDQFPKTDDGYYIVTESNNSGVIDKSFHGSLLITHIRLSFMQNCSNWLLVSEIWIRTKDGDSM